MMRDVARKKFPYATATSHDHKAWAKRIMWRLEHKDPTLLPIQIKFAQEAMGIQKQETK